MSRLFRLVLIPIAIIIAAFLISKALIAAKKEPPKKPHEQSVPTVDVITVQPQSYQFTVESQAVVEPVKTIQVSSELAAKVVSVVADYEEGALVTKGQVLLRLDDKDFVLQLAQAKANLAELAISVRNEEAEMRRAKKLGASIAAARQAKLDQAKASYRVAELKVEQAKADLKATVITAPTNGVIAQVNIDEGQYVNVGSQLFSLFVSDKARIRLPITAQQMQYIEPVTPSSIDNVKLTAKIGAQAYDWSAKTVALEQRVDQQTRTFYLQAELEQPYNSDYHKQPLWFGLFVEASIQGRKVDNVFVLPATAISGQQTVYKVVDGALQRQKVNVLQRKNNQLIIDKGLAANDVVVLSRLDLMANNMPVAVREINALPNAEAQ